MSALTWMGHLVACTEGYHDDYGGARGDVVTLQKVILHPKEIELIKLPKSLVTDKADDIVEEVVQKIRDDNSKAK